VKRRWNLMTFGGTITDTATDLSALWQAWVTSVQHDLVSVFERCLAMTAEFSVAMNHLSQLPVDEPVLCCLFASVYACVCCCLSYCLAVCFSLKCTLLLCFNYRSSLCMVTSECAWRAAPGVPWWLLPSHISFTQFSAPGS